MGQGQRGVTAAGGDIECGAGFLVIRNEGEQFDDIARIGEDVLAAVVVGVAVELFGRLLLLGIERHGEGSRSFATLASWRAGRRRASRQKGDHLPPCKGGRLSLR
jgi:hypothetical protein